MDEAAARPPQTSAQWAVQWHGTVLLLVLMFVSPVAHLAWHQLGGQAAPIWPVRANVPAPGFGWPDFRSGSWMQALEQHLREDSPLVFELRGFYNEVRYRLGLLQTKEVLVGRDRWLFQRHSAQPDLAAVDAMAERRAQALRAIAARAARDGVLLLAMVVPDKERVYPERAYGPGGMPPAKAGLYARVLGDLGAAGITAVDLAAVMAQTRQVAPDKPLYYERDTHWTVFGAAAAARAVAVRLAAPPFAERIGPPVDFPWPAALRVEVVPDLAGSLGLRAFEFMDQQLERRIIVPVSATARLFSEVKEYYSLVLPSPGGDRQVRDLAAEARILLAGSSFSGDNGAMSLMFFAKRLIDMESVHPGAAALDGLREGFERIERGDSKARVLLWEFAERSWVEGAWRNPPAF